jgi:hypothetical protein
MCHVPRIIIELRDIEDSDMALSNPHPFNEAGRRLKAALVSYQLGLTGIDRTLKEMPELVDDPWAELAQSLLTEMSKNLGECLSKPPNDDRSGSAQ